MAAWFVALLLVLFSPTVVATDYFFKPAVASDAGHAYAGLVTGDNLVLGDDVATAIPLTPESLSDRIISNRKSPAIDLVSIILVGTNVFPLKDPVYVAATRFYGTAPNSRQVIIRANVFNPAIPTIIQLDPKTGDYNPAEPIEMFSFYGLDHVTIKDLTLDCNFQNRTAADPAIGDSPIRIGAFTVQANTALIKNIRVINAGA